MWQVGQVSASILHSQRSSAPMYALESASTLHVYELWVCALCPDFQGSSVSYTGVAPFPRTILSTRELFSPPHQNGPQPPCTVLFRLEFVADKTWPSEGN